MTTAAATAMTVTPDGSGGLSVAYTSAVLVPFTHADNMQLVFDEEFNGSTLDSTKWTSGWFNNSGGTNITQPANGSETAAYSPAQVSVSGGVLSLTTASAPGTVSTPHGTVYGHITGAITTGAGNSKFYFDYGYAEARIWVPYSSGTTIANWPAWWMDPDTWPSGGEIDIMEGLSGTAAANYHGPPSGAGQSGGSRSGMGGGWHIFAAWSQGGSSPRIDWYYDNTLLGSVTTNVAAGPRYLILANQMGSSIGGPDLIPAVMMVDWVHVYQAGATPITPQTNYTGPGGGATP